MHTVQLDYFKLKGFLGSGSDYEVYAATDTQTGKHVVIKRPNQDYIARKLHHGVDRLSEQLIEVHQAIGDSLPYVAHLLGYTEVSNHNDYFGDSLNEDYRVLVEERARGLPPRERYQRQVQGDPYRFGPEPVRPLPSGAPPG